MSEEKELLINEVEREIYFNINVTPESVGQIIKFILECNNKDKNIKESKTIKIFLNSPGGDQPSMFALGDIILNSNTEIHTICLGYCASAAFYILICGHTRYMTKNSHVLWHGSGYNDGYKFTQSHIERVDYAKIRQNMATKVILERTKMSRKILNDIYEKKQDRCFFIKECLKLGIVDMVYQNE